MTNADRRAALDEVTAARAALVTHLNQLEDAVNAPKRFARTLGKRAREARQWAGEQPAAAAAVAAASLAVVAGIATLAIRIARR